MIHLLQIYGCTCVYAFFLLILKKLSSLIYIDTSFEAYLVKFQDVSRVSLLDKVVEGRLS